MNEPDIKRGLHESEYRQSPGENISALKVLAESPKKYRWAMENPRKPTDDMEFGTALHAFVLEPSRSVADVCVISPYDSFRTKEAREWRDAQAKPIFTPDDIARLYATSDAILNHPLAGWIMQRTPQESRELSVFRLHERTGLMRKGRLDLVFPDMQEHTAIADVKTCQSCAKYSFERSIADYMYNAQAAYYCDLIGATSFYFIAVEKEAPFEVAVHQLDADDLALGRRVYEKLLDRLKACRESNDWPGVGDGSVSVARLPEWARKAQEEL